MNRKKKSHKDNPICPSSSSPQWLSGDLPAMDGQWWRSRIVSVRTDRVFNKHKAKSVNTFYH